MTRNGFLLLLLSLLVIPILLLLLSLMFSFPEKERECFSDHSDMDIGNYVSSYYYFLMKSILTDDDGESFSYDYENNWLKIREQPAKNLNFVKFLPKYISRETLLPYTNMLKSQGITKANFFEGKYNFDVGIWILQSEKQIAAAKIVKPLLQRVINSALQESNVAWSPIKNIGHVVIHFRCADTPFVRTNEYHFQKYSYYDRALEYIYDRAGTDYNREITILSYTKHRSDSNNQTACMKYAESLKRHFLDNKFTVSVRTSSNVEDFATMFYAPAVISSTSSFSFMAGFFGYGIYVQPDPYNNAEIHEDWVLQDASLEHALVLDYYDVEKTCSLLMDKLTTE